MPADTIPNWPVMSIADANAAIAAPSSRSTWSLCVSISSKIIR